MTALPLILPAWRRRGRIIQSDAWVLALCGIYLLIAAPSAPELLSRQGLANIVSNALPLCAVTIGQMLVLITGGIDLSVTATIGLASVAGASAMIGGGTGLGIAAMLATGLTVGLGNGLAVARLGMPPFIVTLTTMMFGSGLAVWTTHSASVPGLPSSFMALGRPLVPLALVAGLALAVNHGLRRTVLGRWLFAVGGNPRTARVSGVPVAWTLIAAYAASGLCAALGAVLYTARLETGSPVLGQRIFLDVIAATVIGGTSLFGGRGTVVGTVCGVVFITLVDNSFTLLGLSSFVVLIAKGALILLAAVIDLLRRRHRT